MKRLMQFAGLLLLLFLVFIFYNFFTFTSKQVNAQSAELIALSDSAIKRFSKALQIKTISTSSYGNFDTLAFDTFTKFLSNAYPLVGKVLKKNVINDFSLLLKWEGNNSKLDPAVFLAHYDVVPVASEDLTYWEVPPFSGEVKEGKIWGRGSIDNKINVIGIMEALTNLLSSGFVPERTHYFFFGHDEEVGGTMGAKAAAAYMINRNINPEYILDEGYAVTKGLVPGVSLPVALIGIAEKGYLSTELSIELEGGHSSIPNKETVIDIMGNAIHRLKTHPFPAGLNEPLLKFIDHIGPEMGFAHKLIFANINIFEPIVLGIYEDNPSSAALVKTTIAPTIFNSGTKDNVIPNFASSTVNFRMVPGQSLQDVVKHIKEVIHDDRIKLKVLEPFTTPSPVSDTNSKGYHMLNLSIKEIFPDAITAPNLVVGGTDSRHFSEICANIYRFSPIYFTPQNINSIHGINEFTTIEDFHNTINFYQRAIINSNN